jgi:hypothetical protein
MQVERESDNYLSSTITMAAICDPRRVIWRSNGSAIPAYARVYSLYCSALRAKSDRQIVDSHSRATIFKEPATIFISQIQPKNNAVAYLLNFADVSNHVWAT